MNNFSCIAGNVTVRRNKHVFDILHLIHVRFFFSKHVFVVFVLVPTFDKIYCNKLHPRGYLPFDFPKKVGVTTIDTDG